ncbi:MAG: ribosome biogenesis GTPase Der [Rudaea sp.]
MLPVVALVGRPNVGKSTLFNVLTRTRDALVADQPGLTRDRHYGICRPEGQREFVVVDTGGLTQDRDGIGALITKQAQAAIGEADTVVFVVDARAGVLPHDRDVLSALRRTGKRMLLAVNKVDGLDESAALAEFATLGLADSLPLASAHGRGVGTLIEVILEGLPAVDADALEADSANDGIRVAIIGRPNVGKSTLVNRLLGEDRVVVSDVAGTTRDSIRVVLERDGKRYTLIDTAGVRRRARVEEAIEKFSVIKTLQSIAAAHVVVVMLDANEGVSEQDATLIGYVLDEGRALVLAANKWDGLSSYDREQCTKSLDRKLDFVAFAKSVTMSALHGSGIAELMRAINRAHASATRQFTTSELTRAVEQAYTAHQPPLVRGHAPKLRFAHPGGSNPPTIIIHGSRTKHIADSYRRYLENFFRKRYKLEGTPVRIEFRESENPFAGRKNVLTDRQVKKRKRLMRNVKAR